MSRLTRSEIDTLIDNLIVWHPIYTPQLRALREQSLSQEAVREEALEGSAEKEISDLTDELVTEGEVWTHAETRFHDKALSFAIRLDSAKVLLLAWLEGLYKLPSGEYLVNETRRQLGEPPIRALKREPNAAGQTQVAETGDSSVRVSMSAPAAPDVASVVERLREWASPLRIGAAVPRAQIGDLMERAAALLEKLGQGWIPVSERLPRSPEDSITAMRVLVWIWIEHGNLGWPAVRFFNHGKWWSGGDEVTGEHITHWMPLPHAPGASDD